MITVLGDVVFPIIFLALLNSSFSLPPTAAPSQFFGIPYGIQQFFQSVQLAFIPNETQKAILETQFANRDFNASLIEQRMGHLNTSENMLNKYNGEVANITNAARNISNTNQSASVLNLVNESLQMHISTLQNLSVTLPQNASYGISTAINNSKRVLTIIKTALNRTAAVNSHVAIGQNAAQGGINHTTIGNQHSAIGQQNTTTGGGNHASTINPHVTIGQNATQGSANPRP